MSISQFCSPNYPIEMSRVKKLDSQITVFLRDEERHKLQSEIIIHNSSLAPHSI